MSLALLSTHVSATLFNKADPDREAAHFSAAPSIFAVCDEPVASSRAGESEYFSLNLLNPARMIFSMCRVTEASMDKEAS